MSNTPVFVDGEDLSQAWCTALRALLVRGRSALEPLVVVVRGLDADGRPREDLRVRSILDAALARSTPRLSVETVANTIFPESLWAHAKPRHDLYDKYRRLWPRIRRHHGNRHGVYFQRLIDCPGAPCGGNQLVSVLTTYGPCREEFLTTFPPL